MTQRVSIIASGAVPMATFSIGGKRPKDWTFAEATERLQREAGARPAAAQILRSTGRQSDALAIWRASRPIGGTLAEFYLRNARQIGVELPDCLRFHPGLRFDPRQPDELPAMVAAVTDLAGVAIQRTFLLPDGSDKAAIGRPKRGLGPIAQGAVCLAPAAPLIGLAEGIETGLSAMELFRVPVWCALGSNLARIVLPAGAGKVAVFADRGEAGERAAEAACATLHSQHRKVTVRYPAMGKDFNDELRARRDGP